MKNIIFFLLIIMTSCGKVSQPNEIEVPEEDITPLDGFWEGEIDYGGNTIKFGLLHIYRGRIIIEKMEGFLDKQLFSRGTVMAKQIHQISKNKYSGIWFISMPDGSLCESTLNIRVQGKLLLLTTDAKTACSEDVLFTQIRLSSPQLDNEEIFNNQHSGMLSRLGTEIISEERIENPSDYQYVSPGSILTIEKTRTIRHQVTIEDNMQQKETSSYGGEVAISFLKAEASKSIAQELGKRFGRLTEQEETFRMSVVLDGNISSNWKITWYDKVKKGVAKFSDDNGKIYTMPFQFTLSTELEARSALDSVPSSK